MLMYIPSLSGIYVSANLHTLLQEYTHIQTHVYKNVLQPIIVNTLYLKYLSLTSVLHMVEMPQDLYPISYINIDASRQISERT